MSLNNIFFLTTLNILVILFKDNLIKKYSDFFKLFKDLIELNSEYNTDLLLIALTVVLIFWLVIQKSYSSIFKFNFANCFIINLFAWLIYYRISEASLFAHLDFFNHLKYIDLIFVLLLAYIGLFIKCKAEEDKFPNEIKSRVPHFAIDEPSSIKESKHRGDILFRKTAEELVEYLINTNNTKGSFAIGVEGIWGTGKTTLLLVVEDLLKEKFKQEKSNSIVVKFPIWQLTKKESVEEEFFKLISKKINIPPLSNLLIDYSRLLDNLSSNIFVLLKNVFDVNSSSLEKFEELKKIFLVERKSVYVFIDELDRLNKDELLLLLKIIRKTANFPYFKFLLAYDRHYLNQIMGDEKFLNKFVNYELTLSKVHNSIIKEELGAALNNAGLKLNDNDKFNLLYSLRSPVGDHDLSSEIKNVRDLKKFINTFAIDYKLFFKRLGNTDFTGDGNNNIVRTLYLLTILKMNYPKLYRELSMANPYLISVFFRKEKNDRRITFQKESILIEDKHKPRILTLLEAIFIDNNFVFSINNVNFYNSFFDLEINPIHISYEDVFNILETQNDKQIDDAIDSWKSQEAWTETIGFHLDKYSNSKNLETNEQKTLLYFILKFLNFKIENSISFLWLKAYTLIPMMLNLNFEHTEWLLETLMDRTSQMRLAYNILFDWKPLFDESVYLSISKIVLKFVEDKDLINLALEDIYTNLKDDLKNYQFDWSLYEKILSIYNYNTTSSNINSLKSQIIDQMKKNEKICQKIIMSSIFVENTHRPANFKVALVPNSGCPYIFGLLDLHSEVQNDNLSIQSTSIIPVRQKINQDTYKTNLKKLIEKIDAIKNDKTENLINEYIEVLQQIGLNESLAFKLKHLRVMGS